LAAVLAAPGAVACGKKEKAPHVASKLPIQRVVLYRNGVGYFERAGKVPGDEIHFKVRESQVGDFLASLAVVTLDGKPVEFVSFPVKQEEKKKKEETPSTPPYPCFPNGPALCPWPAPPTPSTAEEEEEEGQIDVVVKLKGEGAGHDVIIAYVVESPIWRPTYRIVVDDEGGKALLQGWAVVQNMSGEDWRDVRLTVTEGAPLTFRADLANPFVPQRPLVTDRGEVVQAAVSASVSVSDETRRLMALTEEDKEAEVVMPASVAAAEAAAYGELALSGLAGAGGGAYDESARLEGSSGARRPSRPMARLGDERTRESRRYPAGGPAQPAAAPPPPPPPPGLTASGAQASLALLALGSQEGGITTYESVAPVTVRDEASTLVAIFNQRVDASDTLLYRPDANVPLSSQHPYRVVRFTNQAGVALERGPVAIFGRETFLGQGLVEPLPMGATTAIPYAIERGVTVSVERGDDIEEANLVKVVHGVLTVKRYSVRKTKYVVQNLSDRAGKLYIQHRRLPAWELRNLPAGSEEVDALTVNVPLEFKAQSKTEIEVLERSPTTQEVQLLTDVGREAVRLYLGGAAVDDVAGPVLSRALEMAEEIGRIDLDIARFTEERDQVQTAEYEVQNNLYAIDGIARAADLRNRLTQRLNELQRKFAELQTKIIDLTSRRGELNVEMAEALRDVDLEVPEAPRETGPAGATSDAEVAPPSEGAAAPPPPPPASGGGA
jgi:hypothetical protein